MLRRALAAARLLWARPAAFAGAALHPADLAGARRCLDATLVELLNARAGARLRRAHPARLGLQAAQVLLLAVLLGVPKLMGLTWPQKRPFAAAAIIQWYLLMAVRYLLYERPENHIVAESRGTRVSARLDRRALAYTARVADARGAREARVALAEVFDADGRFDRAGFCARLEPLLARGKEE